MRDAEDGGVIPVATLKQLAAPNPIRKNLMANSWGASTAHGRRRTPHWARRLSQLVQPFDAR